MSEPAEETPVNDPNGPDGPDLRHRVAVIGAAGRFPGAADLAELWRNLRDGVESIRFFGHDELRAAGVPAELLADPRYVPARGVLGGAEHFDPDFFGFTPREAELMDPQHRLFLECAWEAFESAGYDPHRFAGKVGVYAGAATNTHFMARLLARPEVLAATGGLQLKLLNDKDFLPLHTSYKLNLRGPSMAVQTACSTSLVAAHLACQSLLDGECDMALAGGSTVTVPQTAGYLFEDGGISSPDGHCRSFDVAARGTVEASGVGVVLLKRLDEALADGDPVLAVIRGSAVNNDGAQKAGFTAPSVDCQAEVVAEALALAGVEAGDIGYVEAHGSGTPLGDPIEVQALTRAFRGSTARRSFCALGSIKSNFGHADAAAGVAGLLKTVAALRHGEIPPSLHFTAPNPRLELDETPFYVCDRLRPWPRGAGPRLAGVSSLGIGGTNAHMVLEEAPAAAPSGPSRPWQLLLLSARTPAALEAVTTRLASHLAAVGEREEEGRPSTVIQGEAATGGGAVAGSGGVAAGPPSLADVAHTLRVGRKPFSWRRALLTRDLDEGRALLAGGDPARWLTGEAGDVPAAGRPVAFLFPGMGDQHPGMAAELYRREAAFRAPFDRCMERLLPALGTDPRVAWMRDGGGEGAEHQAAAEPAPSWSGQAGALRRWLDRDASAGSAAERPAEAGGQEPAIPAPGRDAGNLELPGAGEPAPLFERTAFIHPYLFAVEYSLASLWLEWRVEPQALLGYSLGEYVAACLAGVFTLDDALGLVAERARLIETLPPGGMLAVPLSAAETGELLAELAEITGMVEPVEMPGPAEITEPAGPAARLSAAGDASLGRVARGLDIAAEDGPALTVVGGPRAAVAAFARRLAERRIASRWLRTAHAFHTRQLEPLLPALTALTARLPLAPPSIPIVSCVTGSWLSPAEATDPAYWARHLCRPVRFAGGLATLLADGPSLLLEVGPGATLGTLARQLAAPAAEGAPARPVVAVASLPGPGEETGEQAALLAAAGRLWVAGAAPDWQRFAAGEVRRRVELPTYPFERRLCVLAPAPAAAATPGAPWPAAVGLVSPPDSVSETSAAAPAEGAADAATTASAALVAARRARPYVAPRGTIEATVARAWEEAFGLEQVGVEDNFFELAGHSLLALQITGRLARTFDVALDVADLLAGPTVAELARCVEALRGTAGPPTSADSPPAPLAAPPRLVPKRAQRDLVPLSFDQERLWFIQQLDLASPVYNIYLANRIRGALQVGALRAALAAVVRRHEVLRTSFPAVGGRPVQRIAPHLAVPLPLVDLRALPAAAREPEALRVAERTVRLPFRLDRPPLFRVLLVQTGDEDFIRPLAIHHMITDRLALYVFESELTLLYDAAHAGRADLDRVLPEPLLQFADFAVWQRAALHGDVLARHLDYWRDRLAGLSGLLPLPTDRPRPPLQSPWGERLRLWIDARGTGALRTLARERGVTLFVAGLALWKALLARLTGEERVSVGTPMTYREALETPGTLGFYLNQLVLATDLAGDPTVRDLVARVRETALGAYAHQDLPFGQLVEALRPRRDLSYIPFIQVIFLLLDPPVVAPLAAPLAAEPYWVDARRTQFDITLALFEQGDGLFGMFEYNTDLFDRATAERMKQAFLALFDAAVAQPGLRLGDLPLLAPGQRHQLLHEWGESDIVPRPAAVGTSLPVHRLVRRQAAVTPRAEALAGLEARAGRAAVTGRLTYADLAARADRLARRLRAEIAPAAEPVVAVALERSPRLVAALLAVLEAGGVYLPLDLSHPRERLQQILADSGARLILTGADVPAGLLPELPGVPVLRLDGDAGPVEDGASAAAQDSAVEEPGRLAYLLYTSGTTGMPKGVEVTHGALTAFLAAMAELHPLAAGDSWMAITTPAFDISLAEMLLPLALGARVLLASREVAGDPVMLARALADHETTVLQATPAGWRQLLDAGWRGNRRLRLLCGGEALPGDLARRLLPAGAALWNEYGPTEATVWATTGRVDRVDGAGSFDRGAAADGGDRPVPLGRPLAGTRVHILDRWLRPAPPGVTGELFLGGAGVARGYRGRPELTAERFVPDPFAADGGRLYRTGDRARRRADGAIEFLGRTDRQLKLRGFRVEPAEVEAHLARHPAVAAAAVVPREEPGGVVLGAYLVARPGAAPDALSSARLRLYLQDRLPAYMMPAFYLTLAAFPLTASGKLDRQALAVAGAQAAGQAARYVAPRGPLEEWLAATCAELLGRERVGMADNFFDLGGHSLLGTQLLARLADEWGTEIRLQTLFQIQTLRDLADHILEEEIARATAADLAPALGAPEGPG